VGVIVAVIFTAPVNAQFADDNVKSDGYGNTAAGTDALFTLTPSNESSLGCSTSKDLCISNTALGNNALYSNTTGAYNVAAGAGALYMNTWGTDNVAIGINALYKSTSIQNVAVGSSALADNTSGGANTAVGYTALSQNQDGSFDTATGYDALLENDQGGSGASYNTADGADAMANNTSGQDNTAVGAKAMFGQRTPTFGTGSENTAIGAYALFSYSTGSYNTASGGDALNFNTIGSYNTASGFEALYSNSTAEASTATGYQALYKSNAGSNTASGFKALYANTSGTNNTATGVRALFNNSSGSDNIAEGYNAGYNLTTGSNNIDIGSPGVAGESGIIRIGTITGMTSTQSDTYIAGIYGKTSSGGLPVVINSNGLLGTTTSSARFKTAIEPMGSNTAKLQQLRPVTFHLKSDPTGAVQYGLIAEEVATIYPELVVRDQNGRIDGVRYDELAPMLLNEMQKEHATVATLVAQHESDAAKIVSLEQQLAGIQAALVKLQTRDELVARR
jgi:hypothetical protein